MNGTSGFQEVRSSTSRSPSYRFLHEQRHRFGTGSWYLLHTKELLLMEPQVRMMPPLLSSSQNRIASSTAQSMKLANAPDAFASILAGREK